SGGTIGDNFETDGVVNLTGGAFEGSFEATANAQVNVFGTDFEVDSVPVAGLVAGVPTTIFARGGVPFTATLADGTPFEIDLNTLPPNPGDDFFDFGALLTVTLVSAGLVGDYNDSGSVEQGDLNLVLNNWGTNRTFSDPGGTTFATLPVDQEELNLVLNNWGSVATPPQLNGIAVPEPSSAAFALIAGVLLRKRR
ncbi:MAG: hypothetical protein AAF663_04040, partial [Planctomycetota bacterium]